MKKHHIFIFSLIFAMFFTVSNAFAYQTLILKFPKGENWIPVYKGSQNGETIVQYVPEYQSYYNWSQTLILHSYRNSNIGNVSQFLYMITEKLETMNATSVYNFVKTTLEDAIATRCITKNANMPAQCDIYRAMTGFEDTIITVQYINKDKEDFKSQYSMWLDIINVSTPYYSYYRTDRIMDKAQNFDL